MSYTIQSDKINKNRVFILNKSQLEKRWDPNTYHFERRNILEALKKSGHELKPLKRISSFKKNVIKEIPDGLPYLGLENIESNTGCYIETTNKESISSAVKFQKDQVLFPKLRPYLNKVFFAEFDGICSTEFHVLSSYQITNEFLANFLRTSLVVNQTKYLMSGNTLPRLQTEDVEGLLIPMLSKGRQAEINAIMRNAFDRKKHNEVQAQKLLAGIDDYLLSELGIVLAEPPENTLKNRMFTSSLKKITGNRFDPEYYDPKILERIELIQKHKFSTPLKKQFKSIVTGFNNATRHVKDGVPFLRTQNVRPVELDVRETLFTTDEIVRKTEIGDLLFTRIGVGVGDVAYNDKGSFTISDNIICVSLSNKEIGKYIALFLSSELGKSLLIREKRDTARAIISYQNILNLPIPIPSPVKQKEITDHISAIRQQAKALKDQTAEILKQASVEIEQLILTPEP